MMVLVDSNILIYSANPASPHHKASVDALSILRSQGDTLCVIPQNLIEFWAVATRPVNKNGLGLSLTQTATEWLRIRRLFRLLPDTPAIFTEWEKLVTTHSVTGKLVHDTRIAAAMKVYGVAHILTVNVKDFVAFPHLNAIDPATVTPPPLPPPPAPAPPTA